MKISWGSFKNLDPRNMRYIICSTLMVDGKMVATVKCNTSGNPWYWFITNQNNIAYGYGTKPTKKEAEIECEQYVRNYLKEG